MHELIDRAPEELEIIEIPADPWSADRLCDVELVITGRGGDLVQLFSKMTHLKVIQTMSAGVDGVINFVPDGVTLCSARGSYEIVAEWVVGAILADFKGLPFFRDEQLQGHWSSHPVRRLNGSTVLLVGYGSIAQGVEERLRPFGTTFLRIARHPRAGVHTLEDLSLLLPTADVVVLLVPLTVETEGLVDQDFLAQMKEGALLVNASRGRVIETEALLEALRERRLTAVLDVTDPEPLPAHHPLFAMTNALITPHISGGSLARQEVLEFLRGQLGRFARAEPLINIVRDGY